MKITDKISYEFDPTLQRLSIKVNGSPFGGFSGPSAEREFSRLLETGADINITDMSSSLKNARVRRIRAIWIKLGIDQYRDAILESYDVKSTADLSLTQLDELIDQYSNQQPASEHIRRQRSLVMTLLNKLGLYATNGDWGAVNAYLLQSRIAGKMLFALNSDELNILVKKLHGIIAKKEVSDIEINRQKLLN